MVRKQRPNVPQLLSLTPSQFNDRMQLFANQLGITVGMDENLLSAEQGSPLAQSIKVFGRTLKNRLGIHPTEGWDANHDGSPSDWVLNRWRNFGISGAQLIWGGEAFALYPDVRANPRQTCAMDRETTLSRLSAMRAAALQGRKLAYGDENLVLGLQITHSGIFSMPNRGGGRNSIPAQFNPHPKFTGAFEATKDKVVSDDDLEKLRDRYIEVAGWAYEAGFDFVDVKACHGYFLHQLLGGKLREGKYGGPLGNRMRLFTEIVEGIRQKKPDAQIGTRVSIWDRIDTVGVEGLPIGYKASDYCFAVKEDGSWDEAEAFAFLNHCLSLDINVASITFASPYYSSPYQRPAYFFPNDTPIDPVDPLFRCLEQMKMIRRIKEVLPQMTLVGASYSYLQHFTPQVLQWLVRNDYVDMPGLCRAFIADPRIVAHILEDGVVARNSVCRTYSDCTSGARLGYPSGCFPLVEIYRKLGILPHIMAGKRADCEVLPDFNAALSTYGQLLDQQS